MHVAQLASFACEMLGPRIGAFSNLVLEIGLCPVLTGCSATGVCVLWVCGELCWLGVTLGSSLP